jgi:RNA polymerase sigma-70 factor, ECF subfamily
MPDVLVRTFLHMDCGFSYTLCAMTDLSDPDQFEAAYRSFAPLGFRIARRLLGDSAAAEEVVQDLFLQLWRNPGGFDAARGPLQSYVAMLARSRSIDRWRTRSADMAAGRRLVDEARALRDDRTDGADRDVLDAEERRQLVAAVRRLPSEQREAILLAYGGGLSAREIADRSDLPLGTAKSRIRLGLSRARTHLSEAA